MSYIYKITNLINGKIYIGLTTRTVEMRWKEHCRHSSQEIDKAIQIYGKENFIIETLEECTDENLDDREKYWINFYNCYENGYNNTLGGRDDNYIMTSKMQEVLELWNEGLTVNKIVKKTELNVETVRSYLNKNNISHEEIRQRANRAIGLSKSKPVLQYDLDGNFIKEWPTAVEAAEALHIKSKYITSTCRGHQKTYSNMKWRYKDEESY